MTAIDSPIFASAAARSGRSSTGWVIRPRFIRLAGPIFTAIASLMSCGLLPLFAWLWQWNTVVRQDLRGGAEPAGVPLFRWVALVTGMLLVGELADPLLHRLPLLQVYHLILGDGLSVLFEHHRRFVVSRPAIFWNNELLLAYGCYWAAVRKHTRRQTKLAGRARLDTGLSGGWVVCGAAFGFAHLWWGIPMMLAGAQQRRYLSSTHLRWRTDEEITPAKTVCRTRHCSNQLADHAQFCPRCGAARR